jgi:hypothetical protein
MVPFVKTHLAGVEEDTMVSDPLQQLQLWAWYKRPLESRLKGTMTAEMVKPRAEINVHEEPGRGWREWYLVAGQCSRGVVIFSK